MFGPPRSRLYQCVICNNISITTMHSVNTNFLYTYSIVKDMLYLHFYWSFPFVFLFTQNIEKSRKTVGTNIIKCVHACDKISQSTSIFITHSFHHKGKICVMEKKYFSKEKSNTGEVVDDSHLSTEWKINK